MVFCLRYLWVSTSQAVFLRMSTPPEKYLDTALPKEVVKNPTSETLGGPWWSEFLSCTIKGPLPKPVLLDKQSLEDDYVSLEMDKHTLPELVPRDVEGAQTPLTLTGTEFFPATAECE